MYGTLSGTFPSLSILLVFWVSLKGRDVGEVGFVALLCCINTVHVHTVCHLVAFSDFYCCCCCWWWCLCCHIRAPSTVDVGILQICSATVAAWHELFCCLATVIPHLLDHRCSKAKGSRRHSRIRVSPDVKGASWGDRHEPGGVHEPLTNP